MNKMPRSLLIRERPGWSLKPLSAALRWASLKFFLMAQPLLARMGMRPAPSSKPVHSSF